MVPQQQPHVLYSADKMHVETLKAAKAKLCDICDKHAGRYVRVELMDGQCFEGILRHREGCVLYLELAMPGHRAFWGPFLPGAAFSSAILPLVLYELLVISLLY